MAKIDIQRHHDLGYERAREITNNLAQQLSEEFNAECRWEGAELRFTRTGASGCVRISEDMVRVEVSLGMLLTPLKGKMESIIDRKLTELIET